MMELKSDIKGRRKERIRSLLEENQKQEPAVLPPLYALSEHTASYKEWGTEAGAGGNPASPPPEPDPELVWKQRRNDWEEEGGGDKPRFVSGFIRRTVASFLVFGAIWGIFAARQPWALKAQDFVTEALHQDMDFAAAQVWYQEHFAGAPSFIPIFGSEDGPAEKVTALHELDPPLTGSIVQPYISTLKGVEIMPADDSGGSVAVKSVDTGRVISVSKEPQGGIRVIVRHTGSLTAEYGHLSGTKLAADDWVQSGDTVGWMQAKDDSAVPLLFFAIMKDKTYIDPAEVVSFE